MKILFFDTWTKGIRNFSRLTDKLESKGCTYKLVHLESWDGVDVPKYQKIGKIDCYDISYYNSTYIYSVLKQERPDVVLMLSLSYLLDRVITSMCNKLGIKIVYLAHGKIYMKEGIGNLSSNLSLAEKINKRRSTKKMMIIKNYFRFNLLTRFRPDLIFHTLLEFVNHSDKSMYTPYCSEFKVNAGMVYYESEKEMFENERHFPKGMIQAVGNPEMDSIINARVIDKPEFLKSINFDRENYALYMDDGFTQEGLFSYEEWKSFINEVYVPLRKRGISLIIKLHPRTNVEPMNDFLKEQCILAIKDVDFKNVCAHADFVLSHSSSTVMYGMIVNKPVLLPRWGKMTNLVRNYPEDAVTYVETLEDYASLVKNGIPHKDTSAYLKDNCGNLDGKAIDRIVEVILSV